MCLGIPGKVIELGREHDILMGKVDFDGIVKRVCLEHVPEIGVGDYALVHVGLAITKIDEEEARQIFDFLKGTNDLEELEPSGVDEDGDMRER